MGGRWAPSGRWLIRDRRLRMLARQPVADPARVGIEVYTTNPSTLIQPNASKVA